MFGSKRKDESEAQEHQKLEEDCVKSRELLESFRKPGTTFVLSEVEFTVLRLYSCIKPSYFGGEYHVCGLNTTYSDKTGIVHDRVFSITEVEALIRADKSEDS